MNYANLSSELRNVLKARGITYKDVATELRMSESGVKKLLTAKDISFNKLRDILKLANIELSTLLGVAGEQKSYTKLSKEQDAFLSSHLNHFHFLVQLQYFDMNLSDLKKANPKLSKRNIDNFLSDVAEQGLVNLDGDKITSDLTKGFRYGKNLEGIALRNINRTFFKKLENVGTESKSRFNFYGLGTFTLSHESLLELRKAQKELLREFSQRSQREAKVYAKKDLVDVGFLLATLPMTNKELYPIEP